MVIRRGELWWANLREPIAAEPGHRRPILIVSKDSLNESRLQTVIAVCLSSNLAFAGNGNNILLLRSETGLVRDSVVNLTQILTIDKVFLSEYISDLEPEAMKRVEEGLRSMLQL